MFARQRGATFLGMLVILAILGVGLYAGIRLVPIYFEYMSVVRAMEQTAKEENGDSTNPQALRRALNSRWTVEDIKTIDPEDLEIKKTSTGFTMRAEYRAEAPFVANVSLVVDFDKTVNVD
jgi:hypothetical protein